MPEQEFRCLGRKTYQHVVHTETGGRKPETGMKKVARWQDEKVARLKKFRVSGLTFHCLNRLMAVPLEKVTGYRLDDLLFG